MDERIVICPIAVRELTLPGLIAVNALIVIIPGRSYVLMPLGKILVDARILIPVKPVFTNIEPGRIGLCPVIKVTSPILVVFPNVTLPGLMAVRAEIVIFLGP